MDPDLYLTDPEPQNEIQTQSRCGSSSTGLLQFAERVWAGDERECNWGVHLDLYRKRSNSPRKLATMYQLKNFVPKYNLSVTTVEKGSKKRTFSVTHLQFDQFPMLLVCWPSDTVSGSSLFCGSGSRSMAHRSGSAGPVPPCSPDGAKCMLSTARRPSGTKRQSGRLVFGIKHTTCLTFPGGNAHYRARMKTVVVLMSNLASRHTVCVLKQKCSTPCSEDSARIRTTVPTTLPATA